MKLPHSGSIRGYVLHLFVTVVVLVFSVSSVHAKLVTFRYEGQLSSVDSALSDSFSKGGTFSGMYTFETTLTNFDDYFDQGEAGSVRNAISTMSFSNGVYSATLADPVRENIIYSTQQGFGFRDNYRVNVSMDSQQSLGGYSPDSIKLFWVASNFINWSAEKLGEQILPETPGRNEYLDIRDFYDSPLSSIPLLDGDGNLILAMYSSFDDYFKDDPERPVFNGFENDEQFFPSDRVKYDGSFTIRNGTMDFSFINEDQSTASISGFLTSVTVVPIPAAVWLFGTGLLGLIGWNKRKNM